MDYVNEILKIEKVTNERKEEKIRLEERLKALEEKKRRVT